MSASSKAGLIKRLILGVSWAVIVSGQTIRVPASSTDHKTPGAFSVNLESPADKAPVALQWEFAVPPAIVIRTADITIGKAAQSAQKALTCAMSASKPDAPGAVKYTCILAGGQAAIGNGTIAVVQYRAELDVDGAPIRVALTKILGVSADLKQIAIPNTAAIITIK